MENSGGHAGHAASTLGTFTGTSGYRVRSYCSATRGLFGSQVQWDIYVRWEKAFARSPFQCLWRIKWDAEVKGAWQKEVSEGRTFT